MSWLLYGAYGYTGRLIAREARDRSLSPILAGRDRERLASLAGELGMDARTASLDDPRRLRDALDGVELVLHAAGPFRRTFGPMIEACLDRGCHYLDITGEIAVFEAAFRLDRGARDAGVVVLPGVGFDVVPTDAAAVVAAGALPAPVELDLAFVSTGGASPGTLKTVLEGLAEPARVRRDGRLVDAPHGSIVRRIGFRDRERTGVAIPWGDVSTAYRSTGIPNVRVFSVLPPILARAAGLVSPFLRARPLRRAAEWIVERTVSGPDDAARARGRTRVRAEVRDAAGRSAAAELTGPDGYTFTARSAVAAVEGVLAGEAPGPGVHTPTSALGVELVDRVAGTAWAVRPETGEEARTP